MDKLPREEFIMGGGDISDERMALEPKTGDLDLSALRRATQGISDIMRASKLSMLLEGISRSSERRQPSESPLAMFTYEKRRVKGEPMLRDYHSLREAVLELLLAIKVRPDEEIDAYGAGQLKKEKGQYKGACAYELIDMIKAAI